ncbi:hypothetical protein VOLCADRAFT_105496 [Volvox carteri f. nagariensis]|uniref:AAA+ ATPase domain-containing protein n=1 Tax=Volvox carteri f. nagariensis TaxID=3068 RepID=D8U182_VOLCA|nr:uncharacterized protein VOLCADRAFT_105496 [Volvox carteri f. nagariensis]EFJ46511.1 hypothetical protein VOLCADRAFT_105496 [Volvox carteri f. nagariensis]|eukprot:XP_002952368.1 hypothetical protein VOLCADRAFT_105496 [Volvox carteri f. nagariensis]
MHCSSAREPAPQNVPSDTSSSPAEASAGAAADGLTLADITTTSPLATTGSGALVSAAGASAGSPGSSFSSPLPPQQQVQGHGHGQAASTASPPAPAPGPGLPGDGGDATAAGAATAGISLPPVLQRLLAWLASVWSAVQQFPVWVQMQHLRRLREACEEDPKLARLCTSRIPHHDAADADKHAAYLAELARTNPREVLARVESRQFGINAAVVAEYLRALVATGKVSELVKADGSAAAAVMPQSSFLFSSPHSEGAPPRTLTELLRDLHVRGLAFAGAWGLGGRRRRQEQLVSAAGDGAPAGDGAGGAGGLVSSLGLEVPGSSVRRPLHVVVGGLAPLQQMVAAAPSAAKVPLLLRPLTLLWRLTSFAVLLVVLAFAYIAGSQAIRRVQASGGAFVNPAAVGAGPPVSAAGGGGSGSGASASSSSGAPSVEPKEYKKDELPEKSIRTFKDVKGCDEAKEELREVVEFLKNPGKFTRLGAKLPKGVLLTGPPGTGKTLLAKAVAGEAGVPFFYRAGSEFEELYVGVGSRRMRALFAAAKKRSPCIVFIDEIDAIGGNRKAWENHTRKTLNQLLVEMDGFESTDGIIVMAATNLPESLDPALKRPGRFDRQVAVPLPDIKGRRDILEYYLSDKPLGPDVDRELLARQTQGFSGADLSNLINEGAILAAKEGADAITQRMLDWAYDKILMGVERKSVKRTLEARRRTAFHEAGHALVALATPGASPIHKATIVPRGHALGMVTQVGREDEFSINRQQMLARIRVCMGGTVAEELVFGSEQVSSGATDDLRQATSMARHMVAECGMSTAIGPVYVAAHEERHGGAGVSEATRQRVDAEVATMLADAKEVVRALLLERMQDLTTLAEALLDKETLTREEINSLLQQGDQQTPPPQTPGGGGGGGGSGGGGGGGRRDREGEEPLEGDPAPAAAQVAGWAAPQSAVRAPDSATDSATPTSGSSRQHQQQESIPVGRNGFTSTSARATTTEANWVGATDPGDGRVVVMQGQRSPAAPSTASQLGTGVAPDRGGAATGPGVGRNGELAWARAQRELSGDTVAGVSGLDAYAGTAATAPVSSNDGDEDGQQAGGEGGAAWSRLAHEGFSWFIAG